MAKGNSGGGNSKPRTTPHTLSTKPMGGGLFATPKVFETPRLSSIDILAKGKCAKVGNFYSSTSSGKGAGGSEARFMRMVNRAPEVMVKVTGGGMSSGQIRAHLEYISRNGKLDLETGEGEELENTNEIAGFVDAWDIDSRFGAGEKRQAYNVMLSMPQGTDPESVKLAARAFAQEQFGGKYPYAMVLHTDKAHPHVHICVRMTPEERKEKKLFIRKDTLEAYRQHFAEKLVERGIEAAATPREYRGVTQKGKKIAVYHAEQAGRSTVAKAKMQEVATEVRTGVKKPEPWKERIAKRRQAVLKHYEGAIAELEAKGKHEQAARVRQFAKSLPTLQTEKDVYRKRVQTYLASKQEPSKQRPEREMSPLAQPSRQTPQAPAQAQPEHIPKPIQIQKDRGGGRNNDRER